MVDSLAELSELSTKLNQKSDKLNSIISTVNEKLKKLNFGIEVWLDGYNDVYQQQLGDDAFALGYANFRDHWLLAVKHVLLSTVQSEDAPPRSRVTSLETFPQSLLEASRNIRVEAVRRIPRLLDALKSEAERILIDIERAEQAAEKL